MFDLHIGIDYSGARTPLTRSPTLQVYTASVDPCKPVCVRSPASTSTRKRNWCRREIAHWLMDLAASSTTFIAGIDHGFSFPIDYFYRYQLDSWEDFLNDFTANWPTDQDDTAIDDLRYGEPAPERIGAPSEFRITERWSSSAKSVFQFDVQGSVAKSTHAGLPWIARIRNHAPDRIHCWPFDGWDVPPGRSVLAEVYPSILRNRYPRDDRSVDQQDAMSIARWLCEMDHRDVLPRYFDPPLDDAQRQTANLEGWILGIA